MNISPKWNVEHASLNNGFWFYFKDELQKITAFSSTGSGKEIVFYGEDVVSEKRSFWIRNRHSFSIGKHSYELDFVVVSLLTGKVECVLYKNGVLLERQTKAYQPFKEKFGKGMWIAIFAGVVCGLPFGFYISSLIWK